jgi:uncharacterized protein YjiS (DUF1127 family)
MLSNNSRALKSRPDVRIDDSDRVFASNHKLTLVPRPDLGNGKIHVFGPEATNDATDSPRPVWSVVFTYLMEGFVLYGASVHPNAFPIELFRTGDNVSQSDEVSRPRGLRAVVASSANVAEVATLHPEQASGKAAVASVDAGFFEPDGVEPAGVVRRNLRRIWNLIAGVRAHWRREREIKKAVYALAEFDDRTLRDMGIRDRYQIERTVRQGRDR